jgi:2-oxo-4-hydroxy-4-carboxy-5-ureidoimidazoline decarboxylase
MMQVSKLEQFNQSSQQEAVDLLMQCNTSERWCKQLADQRPVKDFSNLIKIADDIWQASTQADLLEAFEGHPEIGDVSTLREKYQNTAGSAGHEQSGVDNASEDILLTLTKQNKAYKEKFGFIFIVCASGKSADEMLALLQARLPNRREDELINAAEEQRKISHIRLKKIFNDFNGFNDNEEQSS